MRRRSFNWRARCSGPGTRRSAKEHFKRFQHLTSTKIAAPIGLAYGEQGHYSTVTPVEEPEAASKAMIPVKLVAKALVSQVSNTRPGGTPDDSWTDTTGGACMMDVTGDGHMDLVLMQTGAQAIRVLHSKGDGSFEELDAAAAGLKASGHAVACAVGDYDGDGLNDLAVALDDAVLLFRNLGKGKFQDVTAEAGLAPRNRPTGITFIDYDHDGDLDLFVDGRAVEGRRCAECAVAQQRQQDFYGVDGADRAWRQREDGGGDSHRLQQRSRGGSGGDGRWALRR